MKSFFNLSHLFTIHLTRLHKKNAFTELPDAHSYVIKEPAGVAALISPWNLPLYLLTWKIAPCLAFGCTAICKPSEFTSTTAFLLCKVFQDAGLPKGVCNIIFGTGPNAGSPLINHPKVPLLSFTGGTATGKLVYKAAAEHNKKVSLELGGKNANIIFADCDFKTALTTSLRSSFSNQGEASSVIIFCQLCVTYTNSFVLYVLVRFASVVQGYLYNKRFTKSFWSSLERLLKLW